MAINGDIGVTGLPEGFTHRPATFADAASVVELCNLASLKMLGTPDLSLEDTQAEWQTPGFNLADSTQLVFDPNGKLVGYFEVWDGREPPLIIFLWGRVHPDYERRGIGSALLRWGEQRARQAVPRAPQHARIVVQSGSPSSYLPSNKLLASCGMQPVRYFQRMKIVLNGSVPLVSLPDGIRLETYRHPQQARQVFSAVREAFHDHWGHVEESFEEGFKRFSHSRFEDAKFDPSLWLLAMDGEEIAGFSLCRSEAFDDSEEGFVSTLGVRRNWRKQGLGLALLQRSFQVFQQRGQKSVGLFVDASSLTGATRLYEKAGMHVYRQFTTYEKELRPGVDLVTRSLEQ